MNELTEAVHHVARAIDEVATVMLLFLLFKNMGGGK